MKKSLTIAFIGCGNLSTSLVKGLIASNYPKENIWVTNRTPEKNKQLQATLGVNTTEDNLYAVEKADVLVLGIKPQQMSAVTQSIRHLVQKKKPLIISVAVAISTDMLSRCLGSGLSIIRSMPNIPTLVSAGASGLFANERASDEEKEFAETLHRVAGMSVWVDKECLIDVVAALSGSGPAYFFYMMEAMQAAAIKFGLSEKVASALALQTALGASKLAIESDDDLVTLRRKVTSPQGTTEQAIKVFDRTGFPSMIEEAMQAAICRAEELTASLNK